MPGIVFRHGRVVSFEKFLVWFEEMATDGASPTVFLDPKITWLVAIPIASPGEFIEQIAFVSEANGKFRYMSFGLALPGYYED
jgi:hypothetical protein